MRQRRYRLWSVDPLTDDARPLIGTCSLTAAQRIAAVYNRREDCHRILEYRPVDVEVPKHHVYACRVRFAGSGKTVPRHILAPDAYAAFRQLVGRFGAAIDCVGVWLFPEEMEADEPPILHLDRHGRTWSARRIAS